MKRFNRMFLAVAAFFASSCVFASEAAQTAAADGDKSWLKMLAAGLTITAAAIGGAMAQGKTASIALEAIGRNPSAQNKIFVPMIVALALIESLVIYALVVVFAKM